MPKPVEIYQIKVTLRDSQPPVWRRIQVKSGTTLAKLHRILQRVMGWDDSHLHQFILRGQQYGARGYDDGEPRQTRDERRYTLGELVAGGQFVYLYDFGDSWEHVLAVEKALPSEEGVRYPLCLAGARACPPEDVGGIPGYENFLEVIKDGKHPEHEDYLEWIGDSFDSEAFDVDEINRLLRALR